jgi:hypothetical protein
VSTLLARVHCSLGLLSLLLVGSPARPAAASDGGAAGSPEVGDRAGADAAAAAGADDAARGCNLSAGLVGECRLLYSMLHRQCGSVPLPAPHRATAAAAAAAAVAAALGPLPTAAW